MRKNFTKAALTTIGALILLATGTFNPIVAQAQGKAANEFVTTASHGINSPIPDAALEQQLTTDQRMAFDLVATYYPGATSSVVAIQTIYLVREDGDLEHWEMVVTRTGDFWVDPEHQLVSNVPPPTTQAAQGAYLVGLSCDNVWHRHPRVVFYLPTCFYEIYPGRFDNIVDAWASSCNPDVSAWEGRGFEEWYNYHDCSGRGMSRKVAKTVQTTWLWHNYFCGDLTFNSVARRVSTYVVW